MAIILITHNLGVIADPANLPSGCFFHPRRHYAIDMCRQQTPVLEDVQPGPFANCHRARDLHVAGARNA